jgi:hypothetical protein
LDPTWSEVLAQFANAGVYTPNFFHFFILIGFPLVIALITAIKLIVNAVCQQWQEIRDAPIILFLLVWFVFGWLLTYIPTDFQIHMINSWQVPVILLAGIGLFRWILPWFQKLNKSPQVIGWISTLIVAFCALTNMYLFAWRFYDLHRYDYPFFLHKDEVAALHWLEQNTPNTSIVLSDLEVGQYIPGISGRTAFLAHWAQTIRFYDKQEVVDKIFDPQIQNAQKIELLKAYQVDYVLSGNKVAATGAVGENFLAFLKPVWTSKGAIIYSVETISPGISP